MRTSTIQRKTYETDIEMTFQIDGTGQSNIDTSIGFFDHMLTHIIKHGFFNMDLKAVGDLSVDTHHTVEDVGIVFGQCLLKALGDKTSIKRYGSAIIPMDETLVMVALDLSGRTYLGFDCTFTTERIGSLDTEMIEEFFKAVSANCPMNLHIKVLEGKNNHHIAEGVFKAFGRALDEATMVDSRIQGVLSTKGIL